MSNIRVLGDRILLGLLQPEGGKVDKTDGGIHIPNVVEKAPENRAKVLDLGDPDLMPKIKTGDTVIFDMYAGVKVKQSVGDKDIECLIVRTDDIIAVVSE